MIAIGSQDKYWTAFAAVVVSALIGNNAIGQPNVTVSEIRVVDADGKGIKARVIELTRERKELDVDETDGRGILNRRFVCQPWHKLFARPIAGPYTQSDFTACQPKTTLKVYSIPLFPQTSVRVVVPFTKGSSGDEVTRTLVLGISEALKQEFIVINRPEQGGAMAAADTASAAPDGYTLLLSSSASLTIFPIMSKKVTYDTPKDFAPITLVANVPNILVASRAFQVDSLKDLVEMAKKNPGAIKYSSPGYGTLGHLAGEQLNIFSGSKLAHIPYKGSADAIQGLLRGDTQVAFTPLPGLLPRIKSGELRALAVTTQNRISVLPDVPTVAETGIPGYDVNNWLGLVAPAGTPKEIVNKLNTELGKILARDDIRGMFLREGLLTTRSTPEQFAATINSDLARWNQVVRAAAIQLR